MKTITIGDLHGLDLWKSVDPGGYDKIIFLGDYVDSFFVRDEAMIRNLSEIIAFKYQWPDKVILLMGNHEMSYLGPQYRSTGYRPAIAGIVKMWLQENIKVFEIAWQYRNYLWSHAGLHQEFYEQKIRPKIIERDENLAGTLQRLFRRKYPPIFEVGFERGGNYGNIGGPLWLDKRVLVVNPLRGYHQIVGHTPVSTIRRHTPYRDDPGTTVTLCDCLERGDGMMYEVEVG